ncbi:uncharacterized protein LOC141660588 [Apium graveolens]|uniref:uncharacterized protein LOC141660588 n=1 Tax=Apium graveolens TaxID=4045 RepID=UPI003D7A2D27
MLKLHNWWARFGISDNAFTDLLSSVGSLLSEDHVLPVNVYEAKKTLSNLGLKYIKCHTCPNECVLYRGVNENASECPKCRLSCWKLGKDGKARFNIPAKNVDYRWPTFGNEPRNLRLALAEDGINPHNNGLTNRYSCWPVVLVTYNLPSWLCMKRKFMMLIVLVSGPHEPGNNINVFLQPLIDDLLKLWEEGEPNVYDASTNSFFTLRAMLLWTINDFPTYGNLSGCVNQEYMSRPVLEQQEKIKFTFGKEVKKAKKKNVCDNLIGTLLNIMHKSKDSEASRNDMTEMGIRLDLAPQVGVKRTYLPLFIFTLTKAEKRKVLKSLLSMKLSYGHASNIKNCVSMADTKLFGLKSHDFHILLQQLLPVAIWSVLPKNVKVVNVSKLEKLQENVVLTLFELEKIFPPSFFDSCTTAGLPKDHGSKLFGPLFAAIIKSVEERERDEAHLHLVHFARMHKEYLEHIYGGRKKTIQWLIGEHTRLFADWFQQKVNDEIEDGEIVSQTI